MHVEQWLIGRSWCSCRRGWCWWPVSCLGKLLALMDRVASLEASASEISYELVAADQRRDVELMRERVQNTENELIRLGDDP